jgi:hypothetical protein
MVKTSHPSRKLFPASRRKRLVLLSGWFLAVAAAAFSLPAALFGEPAQAAPAQPGAAYRVDSTLDAPDADPADGVCATAGGVCTLRAAVMQANFLTAPVTITLPAGTYRLTRPGQDDNALVGDLDINRELAIQGAGPGQSIIDGNGAVTDDRAFEVHPAASASLVGLEIVNGAALNGGGAPYYSYTFSCFS